MDTRRYFDRILPEKYCAKCGKMFIPNPNWMYKLRKELTKGYMYFCSYSCYRKAGGDNGKQTYVRGKQPK